MCDTGYRKGPHENPWAAALVTGERNPVTIRRHSAQPLVETGLKHRERSAITRHRQRPDIRRAGCACPREGENIARAGPAGWTDGVTAFEAQYIATPIDVDQPKR